MDENLKVELERAKMRNYILEKENEILLGSIGALSNEKKKLLEELRNIKESKSYRTYHRIKRLLRRK